MKTSLFKDAPVVGGKGAALAALALNGFTVPASLSSDAAILYRRELDLDPISSAMAVVIQKLSPAEMVIEAVPGLNEGLVDGDSVTVDGYLGILVLRRRE